MPLFFCVGVDLLHLVFHTLTVLDFQNNRDSGHWSQEKLAELANTKFSYIGAVERGEKNMSILTLERIANALGVPIGDLFEYTRLSAGKGALPAELNRILVEKNEEELSRILTIVKVMK